MSCALNKNSFVIQLKKYCLMKNSWDERPLVLGFAIEITLDVS